jgi:putative ABC transport system permease protein
MPEYKLALARCLEDAANAYLSLRRRPARSFLSGLGIGIGVIAIVTMLSISEGGSRQVLSKIESLGIIENATAQATRQESSLLNLSQGLTLEDADRLAHWLGNRAELAYYVKRENILAIHAQQVAPVSLVGVNAAWFAVEELSPAAGRVLHDEDLKQFRRVCVLGQIIARELRILPGQILMVDNMPCHVIGVLRLKGRLLTEGTRLSAMDFDRSVYLPLSALPIDTHNRYRARLDGVTVALRQRDEAYIHHVSEQAAVLFSQWHRGVEDILLVAPLRLLREARATQRLFALITGTIAGLSLLVGGIGVMNVMLANIAEQTREIGLRMAVGATKIRIVVYVLWHSVLLSLFGAVWGLILGIFTAYAIQVFFSWEIAFSLIGVFAGPLAAVVSGILFGLHPALRAASLDPAIALRDS